MISGIRASLAYRLPLYFQQLLKLRPLSPVRKPSAGFTVVMMTGKNHLLLSRLSVYSIAKNWNELPKLILINDGSAADQEILSSLSFWKGELTVKSWEDSSAYHSSKNRPALLTYARAHIFG